MYTVHVQVVYYLQCTVYIYCTLYIALACIVCTVYTHTCSNLFLLLFFITCNIKESAINKPMYHMSIVIALRELYYYFKTFICNSFYDNILNHALQWRKSTIIYHYFKQHRNARSSACTCTCLLSPSNKMKCAKSLYMHVWSPLI